MVRPKIRSCGGRALVAWRGTFAGGPWQREHLEEHREVFQKWCLCLTRRCGFRLPEFLHQLRRKLLADVLDGVLAGPLVGVIQVPVRAVPRAVSVLRAVGLTALDHLPL